MTIKALYPTVRPTLNLDFAKTKVLDPRVTFTRASTATFVGANGLIQTAASGASRFDHDPATGESLGLLVEEARTNTQTYSEQFDNAAWTKTGTTVTANAVTAPDGTLTADKLVNDSSTGTHIASGQGVTFAPLTSGATFTCYFKAAELSQIAIGYTNTYVIFNLATGTVFSTVNSFGFTVTSSIQSFPNGWYRCSITVNTGGSAFNPSVTIWTADNSGNISYTGNGTSGIYVWGAQVEAGAYPTSYIPTTSATVTRAADVASMTGTNFSSIFSASNPNGCMYVSAISPVNATLFSVTAWPWRVQREIVTVGNESYFWSAQSGPQKLAINNGIGANALYLNGSLLATLSTTSGASNGTQLNIGNSDGRFNNGPIARLTYYPVRLPDTQLQALTAS